MDQKDVKIGMGVKVDCSRCNNPCPNKKLNGCEAIVKTTAAPKYSGEFLLQAGRLIISCPPGAFEPVASQAAAKFKEGDRVTLDCKACDGGCLTPEGEVCIVEETYGDLLMTRRPNGKTYACRWRYATLVIDIEAKSPQELVPVVPTSKRPSGYCPACSGSDLCTFSWPPFDGPLLSGHRPSCPVGAVGTQIAGPEVVLARHLCLLPISSGTFRMAFDEVLESCHEVHGYEPDLWAWDASLDRLWFSFRGEDHYVLVVYKWLPPNHVRYVPPPERMPTSAFLADYNR